jgi:cytochrome c5
MSKADDLFWRQFGMILIMLTAFTFAMFFLARIVAGDAVENFVNDPREVAKRLAPTFQVRVGDPSKVIAAAKPATVAAAPAASDQGPVDGEAVYTQNCAACHVAGVAGAPKFGDEAAWEPRLGAGEDALVATVVKGKGAMPPMGGNPSLGEGQIRAAVQHMLAAVGASAAAGSGTKAEQAAAGQPAAATDKPAQTVVAAAAPAGKPGDATYNTFCVACHISGVAGAPKLDDKDAWATRAGTGFDALVQSVVNGKGAMPPKGGNPALEMADVENVVRYMLEQAGVTAEGM